MAALKQKGGYAQQREKNAPECMFPELMCRSIPHIVENSLPRFDFRVPGIRRQDKATAERLDRVTLDAGLALGWDRGRSDA